MTNYRDIQLIGGIDSDGKLKALSVNTDGSVQTTGGGGGEGTASNVTIANSLPAGDNDIGNVDVLTLPLSFGAGAIDPTTPRTVTAANSPEILLITTISNLVQSLTTRISGDDANVIFTKLNEILTEIQSKTEPADTQQVSDSTTQAILAAINTKVPASPAQDRTTAIAPFATRLTDGTNFYKPTTPADIQPISATSLPLPADAATNTTLLQVRDAIKAQIDIASTIWTDNSGAFYVRRDLINEGTGAITVTFTDPTGATVTPGAGLRPLATTDKDTLTEYYEVLVSGTGYSIGDLLARVAILDVNNAATPSVTSVWLNFSLGTILASAPTAGNIERANETVGTRQVGTWTTRLSDGSGNIYQALTEGTDATGVTMPTGGTGARGWLSGIYQRLALAIGLAGDTPANADTGSFNLNQLFQRLLSRITALVPANLTVSSSRLLVDVGSSISASVSGVYNSTSPTLTNGQTASFQLSQRANLLIDTIDFVSTPTNISVADTGTSSSTGQDNQTLIRGNPTNNSFASYSCSGNSSFAILIENQPSGTPFVGTLQIERSLDPNGTIWTPVGAFVAGSSLNRSQITAECALHGNCSSSLTLRIRAINFTSGIARITFIAGQGTGTITVGNGIRLFDNSSGAFATIKAAATAALASDTAIAVVQRPAVAATILSLQTNVSGGTFNAFSSRVCTYLKIQNITGVDIEYQRGGAGGTWRILNNTVEVVPCTGNANEIGIRRVDQSNTQVTITAEAIAL